MQTETVINLNGEKYSIGQKMEIHSTWGEDIIPCTISEISESGKYIRTDFGSKWYRVNNLEERGSSGKKIWQNSTYLRKSI